MENQLNICLNYHDLSGMGKKSIKSKYTVQIESFRRQLDLLTTIQNVSLNSLLSPESLPKVSYCLTFDNANKSFIPIAEELADRELKGTFFISRESTLSESTPPDAGEIRAVSRTGMDFGSQSCTHKHLNRVNEHELLYDLIEDKLFLENLLGKPVLATTFDGGHFGPREISLSARAGFLLTRTNISGINYLPLKKGIIKSVSITNETDLDIFKNIIDLSQSFFAKPKIRQLMLSFPKYIESEMELAEY